MTVVGNLSSLKKISELSLKQLFFVVTIALIVIYIICAFVTGGKSFIYSIDFKNELLFSDFFQSMYDSMKSYKESFSIYPPFSILCFRILGSMVTPFAPDALSAITTVTGGMVFAVFVMLSVLFLCWFINSSYKGKEKTALIFILIMSSVFLYTIERGNIIIIAALLIYPFIAWYDSEDKWKRYIGYICLALAVNIKIYPIIFSLLILRRKEYREFIYFIVINVIILFTSLLLIQDSLVDFIYNILHNNMDDFMGIGITTPVHDICCLFGCVQYYKPISYIIITIVVMLTVYIVFKSKTIENWKLITLLSIILCTCGIFNVPYCLLYMMIPLVLFLNSEPEKTKENWIYLTAFILMFAALIGFEVNKDFIIIGFSTINGYVPTLLVLFLIGTELHSIKKYHKTIM